MEVVLKFLLPEDRSECDSALHGGEYHSVIQHLDEALRMRLKVADEEEATILDQIRAQIRDELDIYNLPLWD